MLDRLVEVLRGRRADVAGDVEVVVVDPARRIDVERRRADLLPVAGRAAQPHADVAAQLLEARPGAIGRRLEQRGPADVHVGGGLLQAQERVIQRRQTGGSGHMALLLLVFPGLQHATALRRKPKSCRMPDLGRTKPLPRDHFDLAALEPGEEVLDLGSGSGTDVFVAAMQVGKAGRAVGVDFLDRLDVGAAGDRSRDASAYASYALDQGT